MQFDQDLFLALNFNGGSVLDAIMFWVSQTWVWAPFYLWIWWLVYRKVGWGGAVGFLVASALVVVCADQAAGLFKAYVPKLRPSHNQALRDLVHTVHDYRGGLYGTVSAHAANTLGFIILAGGIIRKRWFWLVGLFWVLLVSYSRIYLGVHFPMDILFGWLLGLLVGWIWWRVYRLFWARR